MRLCIIPELPTHLVQKLDVGTVYHAGAILVYCCVCYTLMGYCAISPMCNIDKPWHLIHFDGIVTISPRCYIV